jgi:hypothetical protein
MMIGRVQLLVQLSDILALWIQGFEQVLIVSLLQIRFQPLKVLVMRILHFVQKVRSPLLIKLDFLPLIWIEIANYVQELLFLGLEGLHHGLVSYFELILLLVAHVRELLLGAL